MHEADLQVHAVGRGQVLRHGEGIRDGIETGRWLVQHFHGWGTYVAPSGARVGREPDPGYTC
jgi:hypothetical protein